MCGIAGFFGHDKQALLTAMVDRLTHRGPDGRGELILRCKPDSVSSNSAGRKSQRLTRSQITTERSESLRARSDPTTEGQSTSPDQESKTRSTVGLGHTRLSIIDLSENSNQPLTSHCGRAVIVFNGEIYNYRAKRHQLLKKGYRFNSTGDAEVLLNLYLEYGTRCLEQLDGIFAFAIWDLHHQTLFLARDAFGVKPLYYSDTGQTFLFASEVKSLLASEDVITDFNMDAVYRTVQFLYSPGPDTILKGVKKLEPGHYLLLDAVAAVDPVCYWSWPDYQPQLDDEAEAVKTTTAALRQSVASQLVADVPVGTFLSGGLDSSLVTRLATDLGPGDTKSYTIRQTRDGHVKDGFVDDLPYAIKVAHKVGVDLQFVDSDSPLSNELRDLLYHLDEPQADTAALYVAKISRAARDQGVKVLLSGLGGDDMFGGYRRHYAITVERYWRFLPAFVRATLARVSARLPNYNALLRRISIAFRHADLSDDERLLGYFYWIDSQLLRDTFSVDGRQQLSDDPCQSLLQSIKDLGDIPPLEKMLHLERRHFLADNCLAYTDRMSMKHGVEVRVPFLNVDLANLVMALPVHFKQKGRQGKWLLKKVAEQFLSKSVVYRPKTGFDGPLREWMRSDLVPLMNDCLGRDSLISRGVFNPDTVATMITHNRIGRADYAYPLYAMLCIELWCRIHLDDRNSV